LSEAFATFHLARLRDAVGLGCEQHLASLFGGGGMRHFGKWWDMEWEKVSYAETHILRSG